MASQPTHGDRADVPAFRRAPKSPNTSVAATQPSQLGQRRGLDPRSLTRADIKTLQRALGNLATLRLLSPVLQPGRSVVPSATPANSDVIQRKFSIQTSGGLVEFSDGRTVDGYKEELRTAIRRKRRANDADDIYHYIKTLATAPDDLGSGTWEQLIQTADKELGTPYEDEPPTKKQRREDMKVVEGRKRSKDIDSRSIDMSPTVRLGSWNPEKYGKGTKSGKREGKKSHVLNVLDTYNPAFLGLMEITNAPFLLEGSVRKPGIRNASLPFYNDQGIESLKRHRQFAKTKREGNLGYKPSATYEMHEGPRFTSGGYGENYPAMYNTSQIIGQPTSFTVDLSDGQQTSFDLSQPQQPIPFSSAQKVNRQLVVWKLRFNASPWSFRPVYDREIPVVDMYVGVVHTSPSIDIKAEIRGILDVAKKISNADNTPMVIVGDFYMQRSAKEIWDSLHNRTEQHWEIVHPKKNTNFPHKGEGQIADHSVFDPRAFTNPSSFSVPPLVDSLQPISNVSEDLDLEDYEEYYTGIGADHTTVLNDFTLDLGAFPQTTYTKPRPDQTQ